MTPAPDQGLRVGILQCGEVPDTLRDQFPDYNQMIEQSLLAVDSSIRCESFRVLEGEIPTPQACDAWITTGSRYSVNDDNEWTRRFEDFVIKAFELKIPFVGICYGMQMMAKALGGKVEFAKKGWGVGVATTQIDAGMSAKHASWMRNAPEDLNLVVSHQEQVTELPADAEHIAGSDFCPNGIFLMGPTMLGIQGHPEFTPEYSRSLMNARRNIIDSQTVEAGMQSLSKRVDGSLTFQWIVAFMRGARAEASRSV